MRQWNGLHEYYTMETQKCDFFQKVWNRRNWFLSVPRVSVRREKKSPWLCQYQSCISNWYINGKVFTSTTTWEPIFFFVKKVWNWIRLVLKSWNQHSSRIFSKKSSKFEFWFSKNSWNHLIFVKITPTLVIDTSMERPSRVGYFTIGTQKFEFFYKKVRRRAEIALALSIPVLHK